MLKPPLIIEKSVAMAKAAQYCAYQERCQQELRQKLREWNVDKELWEEVIAQMIIDNFINEERFACAFASGKHRIKLWGKLKIHYALQAKGISNYSLQKALDSIDDSEYISNLQKLIQRYKSTQNNADRKTRQKLINSLKSKGYEVELILEYVE